MGTFIHKIAEETYRAQPDYSAPKHVKVLVAGFTRGGTQYTTWFLRRLGVLAGHEYVFGGNGPREHEGMATWKHQPIEVEVSGLAAPWVPKLKRDGLRIVHLIRHPVDAVNSNLNYFYHQIQHGLTWERTCDLYLMWHKLIEAHAEFTIHLDRFPDTCADLLELVSPNPFPSALAIADAIKLADTGHKRHTARYGEWKDLPIELKKYAAAHGYSEK